MNFKKSQQAYGTKMYLVVWLLLVISSCSKPAKVFQTNKGTVLVKVNNESESEWSLVPDKPLDVFYAGCKHEENVVTFSDGVDSISYVVHLNDTIDFDIVLNERDTAHTRIIGVKPNVNFTADYIKENRGRVKVEIPEVSELANILIALHKDAEKDKNMTNSNTEYFKKVRSYFEPYLGHPMIDTVQKYIDGFQYIESYEDSIFMNDSYNYYYALKMNACTYSFDENSRIVNNGFISEMAKGWSAFDPMKDADLMTDFAEKSNFRAFYQANKPYYDSLIATYNQLNPIGQMQSWLDDKFKFSYGSYVVYFSPLVHGAHSAQNFSDNGFNQSFMFIAVAKYSSKFSEVQNELRGSRVVFTEIDHNYVNPVSDKYLDQINEVFSDREIWAKGAAAESYSTSYAVFNEYMTWAVYTLYMIDTYPEADVLAFLTDMEDMMEQWRGYVSFKAFNRELLKTYKENKMYTVEELYEHMFDWARGYQAVSREEVES